LLVQEQDEEYLPTAVEQSTRIREWSRELSADREEIAIVGMAGRFPGARNLDEFWQNLRDGVVSIKPFSKDQLKACGVEEAVLKNPSFVNSGAVIEEADFFDADFFGYTPLEAEIMDPQHRVLLECAWEALENAGYNPETHSGPVGVFGAVSTNTYFQRILVNRPDILKRAGFQLVGLSNEKDHAVTRISFKLNLKGPSISVQTACSASGVALHLACQSVLSGECDMALAGGARIEAPLHRGYFYEEGDILSPDGQCRVFDAQAQGTVFGNGVAMVVVKRLSDALREGDTIHALIKGTAINNDGSLKAGYSAPSIQGQAKVIEDALLMAEVNPDTIGYVEAHGTGTSLGDPIEIAALTKAYRKWTERRGYCAIGSVKANIGHLFAAAGVAGVIKAVLAIKNRQIPPAANFKNPNPQIEFERSPFFVRDKLSEWGRNGNPRRAAVSSFGMGGTNAHIILEEAPKPDVSGPSRQYHLVTVSARSNSALERATSNLVGCLKGRPDSDLADVSYTLQVGRKSFEHRRIVVCESLDEAVQGLKRTDAERVANSFQNAKKPDVVYMFSGQGSQYPNMGLDLYRKESEFQKHIDRCSEILRPHLGLDLRDVMYPGKKNDEDAARDLRDTLLTQPSLFAIEYALAKLWMSWGVRPAAFVGHSIGEYVGACLAGVFSLEESLSLVAARGRLMNGCRRGAMLAVHLSEEAIKPFLKGGVSLGAVNAPSLCVVSGEAEGIEDLEKVLSERQIDCRRLHTSHAFHSRMMDPIEDAFKKEARQVNFHPPQIPMVSTVTGTWITPEEMMRPDYWVRNFRQTVRFSDCIRELLKEPSRVFLEVGPGQALSTFARQHADGSKRPIVLSTTRHPQEKKSDVAFILNTLGRLWLAGVQVDWSGFYGGECRCRVPLPTYPFERQRYWIESQKSNQPESENQDGLLKKSNVAEWFYIPSWKRGLQPIWVNLEESRNQRLVWLLFLDDLGFGSKLAEYLKSKEQEVITVQKGERFVSTGKGGFIISPKSKDDYDRLIKELRTTGKLPNRIVHFWCFTSSEPEQSGIEVFRRFQDLGFYSMLFLVQALGDGPLEESIEIAVVTNLVHDVLNEGKFLCPSKSTLLAPCKVIQQEYPNISCSNIDFDIETAKESQVKQLFAELVSNRHDPVVAYRGNYRWVPIFERFELRKKAEAPPNLREKGVYLILGGLGQVGLAMSEILAEAVEAKLVLVSRSGLPEKNQWEQWLGSHSEVEQTSRKIRKLRDLEELGAETLVLSADITKEDQLRRVIALAEDKFGEINGVIHAAGVFAKATIDEVTPGLLEERFHSKIVGLFVLNKVMQGKTTDFCLLTSSLASVLGGVGYVGYAAANIFMDAFACKQNQMDSTHWVSINWDLWGFQDTIEKRGGKLGELVEYSIAPEEGRDAFQRILSSDLGSQIVVSTGELQARIDKWINVQSQVRSQWKIEPERNSTVSPLHSRPTLSNDYISPSNKVEEIIVGIWQQLLGIERVGIHDNFFELGGHSLLVGRVIANLRTVFREVEFPTGILFERPTVHLLSKMIIGGRTGESSLLDSRSRGMKRRERVLKNAG
jgi:acyl transferase domain-containing protein